MSKTLTLGLVFSSMGAGAVATAIGSVAGHLGSIEKKINSANSRMKSFGLETVDAFVLQKKELEKAKERLAAHAKATTAMGRAVAEASQKQKAATTALQAYRTELAGQTGRATDEQRAKLKMLREQVGLADKSLKALSREFKEARDKLNWMSEGVQLQTVKLQKLRAALESNGVSTTKLAEHRSRLANAMRDEQARVERLTARYEKLKAAQNAHQQARADLNTRWGDAMAAYGTARALGAPVGAFIRQDDALTELQVTMMDKNGQVHASYETLKRQAIELGNILPGTTADFAKAANALMEQGVAIDAVTGGGLRAASYLSVVMRMPSDQAAEMTAKLREAYKLSDAELTKMADSMQRAKFAFGMKPSDLMAASSYQAPMLNQLGIRGLENTNKMLAIQGMAAQVGLEGSSFGTNFSMMLTRLSKGPDALEMATKGLKGKAREIVDGLGIKFEFFDQNRNFAGLDHMVKELEKLKLIKEKAGEESALMVADALFGAEAARPAMILAEQGMAGFRDAQERMAQQADLQQRIERATSSTRNTLDALGGSLENLGAAMAGPVVQALHPLINMLNSATGWLTDFADSHPRATKAIGFLVLGLGAAVSTFFALGAAMSFGRVLSSGLKIVALMSRIGGGAAWLGAVLKGPLLAALGLVKTAVIVLGRALLMNPIGLIVTGIAVGAFLIYRYWAPIKGFFLGLWGGIKSAFTSAWNGATGFVSNVWGQIRTAFSGGIAGVGKLIVNWSPLGLFYKTFAGVMSWFGVTLPKNFTEFGANIINGLTGGIKSAIGGAVSAIGDFASGLKSKFTNLLGIKSPSTVFMGFGGNIGQGAQLGILRALPGVQGAASKLASVALAGAAAAGSPAFAEVHAASIALPRIQASAPGGGVGHGAGGMTVHFAPNITLASNGGGDVKGQVQQAMQMSVRELEQMLRRLQQEKQRRAF